MFHGDENVHLSMLSYAVATNQCTRALEMWLVQWRS